MLPCVTAAARAAAYKNPRSQYTSFLTAATCTMRTAYRASPPRYRWEVKHKNFDWNTWSKVPQRPSKRGISDPALFEQLLHQCRSNMSSDHWHSQLARKFIKYDPIGITHKLLPEETIQEETNVDRGGRATDTYKHANSGNASLSDPRGNTLRMCHGP